jgi:hypothetical protein
VVGEEMPLYNQNTPKITTTMIPRTPNIIGIFGTLPFLVGTGTEPLTGGSAGLDARTVDEAELMEGV